MFLWNSSMQSVSLSVFYSMFMSGMTKVLSWCDFGGASTLRCFHYDYIWKIQNLLLDSGICIPLISVRNAMSLCGNQPCSFLICVRILMSSSFELFPSASVLFFHRLIHSNKVSWCMNWASDCIVLYSLCSIPRYSTENLNLLSAEIMSVTREISASESSPLFAAMISLSLYHKYQEQMSAKNLRKIMDSKSIS